MPSAKPIWNAGRHVQNIGRQKGDVPLQESSHAQLSGVYSEILQIRKCSRHTLLGDSKTFRLRQRGGLGKESSQERAIILHEQCFQGVTCTPLHRKTAGALRRPARRCRRHWLPWGRRRIWLRQRLRGDQRGGLLRCLLPRRRARRRSMGGADAAEEAPGPASALLRGPHPSPPLAAAKCHLAAPHAHERAYARARTWEAPSRARAHKQASA
mmetsp:Transcript_39711/g.127251  ORF Transcript_39711/g.127251 Transcript_39711/m.127251 type:complete len:212 (+) Transcript_39711:314-949(+)